MSRLVEIVDALLSAPELSEYALRHAVYSQGMDAVTHALGAESQCLQHDDVDRAEKCAALIAWLGSWNWPLNRD